MNKLTLLYAEDDETIRKQYCKYLNFFFDTVYEASNGKEAIDIYDKYKPSILLLDINMPYVDGLKVSSYVRKEDENIPIILLSAHSEKEKLFQAIRLNLVDYLVKPVELNKLKDTILETIKKVNQVNNDKIIIINKNLSYCINKKIIYDMDQEIKPTENESKIIEFFLHNKNNVTQTDFIIDYIWDDLNYSLNRLRTLINRLNKKLSTKLIISRYGVGYLLDKS